MKKRSLLVAALAVALVFTMFVTSSFGAVPVAEAEFVPTETAHDIDGDNSVGLNDVVALAQHVAGWPDLRIDENKLDTNSDGKVTLNDVVYLAQFVAGWDMTPDYSKNIPTYSWPAISPNNVNSGNPVTKRVSSTSSAALAQVLLMSDINQDLPFSVECYIKGNTVTALLPAGTPINALKPEFKINGDRLLYQGMEVTSGVDTFDFTIPVEFTVEKGTQKIKYTVYIMTLDTGIPSMSITTSDGTGITSKTTYETCQVFAGGGDTDNGIYSFNKNQYINASAKIKGRGWTSWYYYPKKSYTLKFDKKQEMLGLPAHKEWVLAANFADRSLVRNAAAMELAHNVGMESVMDVRFVDLWVNGMYAGNYQLIEKIEVSKNRVNITDFNENLAPEEIGYIIETNGHNKAVGEFGTWTNGQDADRPSLWKPLNDRITLDPISGDMFFNGPVYNGIIYNINKPSDTKLTALDNTKMQSYLNYIYDYMIKTETAIKSGSYAKASQYLDMKAMAKWYIVEELSMNTDSKLHCSCYMYKDAGGKLKMGPVWDFDLGFGNGKYANENHVWNTYLDNSAWFASLTQMPEFRRVVKEVWNDSEDDIRELSTFIENTATMLDQSQKHNFELWSITQHAEHTYEHTTEGIDNYLDQVTYLELFTEDRIEYMDDKISNW